MRINHNQTRIEIWGGVECTLDRVGDDFYDQLERNGHASRIEDLEMFAQLGIKSIRYPILWERTAPASLDGYDWNWADQRLEILRKLGIKPIVGLLHHGSGPSYTSLVDPEFPQKLAKYARAVAERYPWIEDYTPVNEPLTTARFSALYGFWYPHMRDARAFGQALLNQCLGTALSMREVRKVNPKARLIQTEDLCRIWSTPHMAYQADFENERRWLSLDILCGNLHQGRPMWSYLDMFGIGPKALEDAYCPPDIIGMNHYLTSERFLDENIERYPEHCHGGNFHERYVDVEAVRVCCDGPAGLKKLLREAWERFRLPLAVTECHLGCTREEQMRWLWEVWRSAQDLQRDGVDIRAVTAWSLLGAYDWNSILTRCTDHYEPGVYDVRGTPSPRPTALAKMVSGLAKEGEYHHPLLEVPGWWNRPERLIHFPVDLQRYAKASDPADLALKESLASPVLITGATGTLGSAFARICEGRAIPYQLLTRQDMDITNPRSVEKALDLFKPWAIINAAGYVRLDDAESEPDLCYRVNASGPEILAKACAKNGVSLVTFSSDLVFDGKAREPYVESDKPRPLNIYGQSKMKAENLVLDADSSALVIRTSAFFGPWDRYNFLTIAISRLQQGMVFPAVADATVSPTYVPDLVHVSLDLLIDGESGIWHVANDGAITWVDLAVEAAERTGLAANLVQPLRTRALNLPAPRPSYTVLTSERACIMPTLESALTRYFAERIVFDQPLTPNPQPSLDD